MTKNKLLHSLTLTIPAKEFAQKVEEKLKEFQKNAKLPGFRPGQAPLALIKTKYAAAAKSEALDASIHKAVKAALDEKKIRPAVQPKIDVSSFEDGKDIELKLEVEALPDIKVADLKKIQLKKKVAKASETEIREALDKLAASKRQTEPSDEKRPTRAGDVIVIDFEGSIDGTPFKGGNGKDYYLNLGSNTFIPGFEDQLVGREIGAQTQVKVTFPDNYHAKDLAGKKAVFKVNIKELRKLATPELNDAFAQLFGQESLEKLKAVVQEELNKEYQKIARTFLKRELLDALDKAHDFEAPQGMAEMEFDAIWKQFEEAKKNDRLDADEKGKSDDELKKEYRAIAERRVRLGLLLAEIADANKVTITSADLTQAIQEEARRFPGQAQIVFDYYKKNPQAVDALKGPLFEEKVVDFILGTAAVSEQEITVPELYAYNPDSPK